ncbi:hypothetical protein [Bacteroides pyogenes]|uniref:Uncharacterized protein n=1 Tax=Bacteroides pyogenes JCM 6292 TaxID=1235809 RepID=W4P6G8_9BACE|nr:hypothetical protein [Bacteroides pyogenes]GAE15387.1 hypothetical protein JCM6292_1654 [Bacteroides pyogenes JCM 6292]
MKQQHLRKRAENVEEKTDKALSGRNRWIFARIRCGGLPIAAKGIGHSYCIRPERSGTARSI